MNVNVHRGYVWEMKVWFVTFRKINLCLLAFMPILACICREAERGCQHVYMVCPRVDFANGRNSTILSCRSRQNTACRPHTGSLPKVSSRYNVVENEKKPSKTNRTFIVKLTSLGYMKRVSRCLYVPPSSFKICSQGSSDSLENTRCCSRKRNDFWWLMGMVEEHPLLWSRK